MLNAGRRSAVGDVPRSGRRGRTHAGDRRVARSPRRGSDSTAAASAPSRRRSTRAAPGPLQRVLLDELWAQSTRARAYGSPSSTPASTSRTRSSRDAVDAAAGRNYLPPRTSRTTTATDRARQRRTAPPTRSATAPRSPASSPPARARAPASSAWPPRRRSSRSSRTTRRAHGTADTLAAAIDYAVARRAPTSSTSPRTPPTPSSPTPRLQQAVDAALGRGGRGRRLRGQRRPGRQRQEHLPGVVPRASSRSRPRTATTNGRPSPSRATSWASRHPGVDMVSTVPGGGHCADNGTSFSAPYVAGVAALLKAKYPKWTRPQIVAQIEQTAERSITGHDRLRRLGRRRPGPRPDERGPGTRRAIPQDGGGRDESGGALGRARCTSARRRRNGIRGSARTWWSGGWLWWRAWAGRLWPFGTRGVGGGRLGGRV